MKHPQPDIHDVLLADFLTNISTVKKLKRYWGTTTVNGVEVLTRRQYYYPTKYQSSTYEKLFTFLDMYDDVEDAEMSGVKKAWIYFNKNAETELEDGTEEDFIINNLNTMWWDYDDGAKPDNLTLTTTIVIEASFESSTSSSYVSTVSTTDLLKTSWTSSALATAIKNNYEELWDTCLISQQGIGVINKGTVTDDVTQRTTVDSDDLSPDDPWMQTVARYALRTTDIDCTITNVSIGYGKLENDRLYPTYVVTIEIPYTVFDTNSSIVDLILTDITKDYSSSTGTKLSYSNGYYTKQAISKMDSTDLEDDDTLVTREYQTWESSALGDYEALWCLCSGSYWALRADVFTNPRDYGLTYKELSTYVLQLIDSDYKKESSSLWQKVVAVVVFVVAIVVSVVTGGVGLTWASLAKAILVGSLVLSTASMVTSAMGATEWASAFAAVSEMIEPLVLVAAIYTAWTSIASKIAVAKDAVAVSLTTITGVTVTAAEVTTVQAVQQIVTSAIGGIVDSIVTGAMDLASMQVTSASFKLLAGMLKVFNMAQEIRLDEIKDDIEDKKAEYEALVEEMEQETDVLQGFARISASPATADWSMYAAVFDYPYEASGGTLHTGNVLRTTKQALRKATYDDPVFDGILLM